MPPTTNKNAAKPAIVFDLDGTLADTAPDLLASLNHTVSDQNIGKFTFDEIGHLVGQGSLAMIGKAFELHGKPLSETLLKQLHQRFLAYYEAHIADHSQLYPGALDLIDNLLADGFPLAVCTNKYEAMARRLLEVLEVADRFAAVTGGDTFAFRKPDARHLLNTINLAGADDGIMIGDTATDAGAAQNAKTPLILVTFGYSGEPVASLGADALIDHFDECHAAIQRLV